MTGAAVEGTADSVGVPRDVVTKGMKTLELGEDAERMGEPDARGNLELVVVRKVGMAGVVVEEAAERKNERGAPALLSDTLLVTGSEVRGLSGRVSPDKS